VTNADFIGYFDFGDCNAIAGWAADRSRPNTPITVSVYDGFTLLTTVLANGSRGDSAAIGAAVGSGDNGLHAFNIPFPTALKTGQPHAIGVRFESTSIELSTSPRSITCVHPLGGVATQTTLELDFKLNNGTAPTTQRKVLLHFTAREKTGSATTDVTANITHFRARESPNLNDADLSSQPWVPLEKPVLLVHELALKNGNGQRYGERKVMFQVKTASLTSGIVSDTIDLEPVLKEFTVSPQGNTNPLIQYAASQGFQFPRSFFETCADGTGAGAEQAISSGNATVTCGISTRVSCTTRVEYELFFGRGPNKFWRIKSVNVSGASIHPHGPNRFLAKFTFTQTLTSSSTCPNGTALNLNNNACFVLPDPSLITIGDVVVEGPEVDDFIDPANPWKNAFVQSLHLIRPTIQPGTRPPN